mmetsp:Transcript_34268/g.80079  ORF Transcript_34268/g.80079 Transcript_34268/m.80079 type:complete len:1006 (+) Transcript_34268:117-3134(+)
MSRSHLPRHRRVAVPLGCWLVAFLILLHLISSRLTFQVPSARRPELPRHNLAVPPRRARALPDEHEVSTSDAVDVGSSLRDSDGAPSSHPGGSSSKPMPYIFPRAAGGMLSVVRLAAEIDKDLLDAFKAAPTTAKARDKVRGVFKQLCPPGHNAVPCEMVANLVSELWVGRMPIRRDWLSSFRNDVFALAMTVDHDNDGALSLDEFIDLMAAVYTAGEEDVENEGALAADDALTSYRPPASREIERGTRFLAWLGRQSILGAYYVVLGVYDGSTMLRKDIKYAGSLILKLFNGEPLSELEKSVLKQAGGDVVTAVPFAAIVMMPLTLPTHIFIFALLQTMAPQVFPSSIREPRLQLLRTLRKLRLDPNYKAWSLFGEGPSEAVNSALLDIFQAKPDSPEALDGIKKIFEDLDTDRTGHLSYDTVLGVLQAMWSDTFDLPKDRMEDFRLDAIAVMHTMDRADRKYLTLGTFTEFVQTLVEVANSAKAADNPRPTKASTLKSTVRASWEGVSMLSVDLRGALRTLKRLWLQKEALSTREAAMLKRTGKDLATAVPYLLIALARIPTIAKALLSVLLFQTQPGLYPSAFRKSRREMAQAWRCSAAARRRNLEEDWAAFETDTLSTELNATLIGLIKNSTGETQREYVSDLFDELSVVGTVTYAKVMSCIPELTKEVAWLDALSLLVQIDGDDDGFLTSREFNECMETILFAEGEETEEVETDTNSGEMEKQSFNLSRLEDIVDVEFVDLLDAEIASPSMATQLAEPVEETPLQPEGNTTSASEEETLEVENVSSVIAALESLPLQNLSAAAAALGNETLHLAEPVATSNETKGSSLYTMLTDAAKLKEQGFAELETDVKDVNESLSDVAGDEEAAVSQPPWWKRMLHAIGYREVKTFVKQEIRDTIESVTMFTGDSGHAALLLERTGGGRTLSKTESTLLRRTAWDLVLFLPLAIIIIAPLTPIGTACVISIFKRMFPTWVPTSFRRRRLQLIRNWRAVRQRIPNSSR